MGIWGVIISTAHGEPLHLTVTLLLCRIDDISVEFSNLQ